MTVLALSLALMSGGLLQERQPPPQFHLVDTSTLEVVTGGLLRATNADLDVMSLQQLQDERAAQEERRRGFVAPIVLLAAGATSVIVGTVLAYTYSLTTVLIGAALYVAGGVLIVVGAILLITAIVNNAKVSARVRRIDERIQSFNAPPPPMMPQGDVPPPPPPPMPPSSWVVPQPQLQLASF